MERNPNLFDLTNDQLDAMYQLEALLEETAGEIDERVEFLLDELGRAEENLLAKLDAYAIVIAQMELDAEAYDAKAAYLKEKMEVMRARSNTKRRVVDTLKSRIVQSMRALGMQKAETPNKVSMSVRKAKAPVIIEDESLVPDEFSRITRKPDKTAISQALQSGLVCDFAKLGEPQEYVVLR
jgi:hypothetical protein